MAPLRATPQNNRRAPTHTHAPPQRATRPHPPTHNATGQLCRSGTGRHEWRPYELRRKTTDAKQRSAAAIQQTHRRGDTCVARNTAAPQSTRTPHLIAQPTRTRRRTTRLVNCVARNTGAWNTAAPNPHAHRPQRATRPLAFPCRNPNGCHECTPTATEKTTPLPVKTGTAPARTGRASTRKCGAIEKLFAY